MNKAIFIDKDGTLVIDVPYNVNPDLISLAPTAAEALQLMQSEGFLLIVISNQSGVARGLFTENDLPPVSEKIQSLLAENSIKIDGFYYCPHHKNGTVKEYSIDCDCRKPKPGMIVKATNDFTIDLSKSWMIGDILNDVEAGKSAGCKTILIHNGNETEWILNENREPDYKVNTLLEAANIIVQQS